MPVCPRAPSHIVAEQSIRDPIDSERLETDAVVAFEFPEALLY
jgi:hypothetical protein